MHWVATASNHLPIVSISDLVRGGWRGLWGGGFGGGSGLDLLGLGYSGFGVFWAWMDGLQEREREMGRMVFFNQPFLILMINKNGFWICSKMIFFPKNGGFVCVSDDPGFILVY